MNSTMKIFLMFDGNAEQAMDFYISLFPDAAIGSVERYGPGEIGAEGAVKRATFTILNQTVLCIDSPVKHAFGFTPAISLFVDCGSETEIVRLFTKLVERGQILMPLDCYPFSNKYAWVADQFGVSWQLNWSD